MSVTPLPLCSLHFWLPIVGQFLSHCPAAGDRRKERIRQGVKKATERTRKLNFFKFFQTHTTAATAAEYMTILNGRFYNCGQWPLPKELESEWNGSVKSQSELVCSDEFANNNKDDDNNSQSAAFAAAGAAAGAAAVCLLGNGWLY